MLLLCKEIVMFHDMQAKHRADCMIYRVSTKSFPDYKH